MTEDEKTCVTCGDIEARVPWGKDECEECRQKTGDCKTREKTVLGDARQYGMFQSLKNFLIIWATYKRFRIQMVIL